MKIFSLSKITFFISLLLIGTILVGCSNSEFKYEKDNYLIQVGNSKITLLDFKKAFEIAKAAYPYDINDNSEIIQQIRSELLAQMTEQLILTERARELHIEVSESELDAAVTNIISGYSEKEFEAALLKSAISYNTWKNKLKIRLLMEKVVAKDLGKEMTIISDKITESQKNGKKRKEPIQLDNSRDMNKIGGVPDRKKNEQAYKIWIEKLRKKYSIKINGEEWKKISIE